MKFKAFIFDLDGTVLDSLQDLADAVNHALKTQGFPERSLEEVRLRVGNGIDKLVISSLPEKFQEDQKMIAKTLESMAQFYSKNWNKNTRLYPDIAELFDRLTFDHIPMAILSNKPEAFLKEMATYYMKKWDFVLIVGSRKDYPLKPNPQSALAIIKKMGLEPSDVALVGDGDADIQTAIAAEMCPIAVTWGLRTLEEQKLVGATTFIHSPLELLEYI